MHLTCRSLRSTALIAFAAMAMAARRFSFFEKNPNFSQFGWRKKGRFHSFLVVACVAFFCFFSLIQAPLLDRVVIYLRRHVLLDGRVSPFAIHIQYSEQKVKSIHQKFQPAHKDS
jgi:hypothetical protein